MRRLHKIVTIFFFCLLPLSSLAENTVDDFLDRLKGRASTVVQDVSAVVLGQEGGNRFFYYPLKLTESLPSDYGYKYKNVYFKSKDGTKLHGWILPAAVEKPRGVVIFSHGNTGTVNSHLYFCTWLVKAGWNVFMYDYRGYGESEGEPARKGMIDDVAAALNYAIDKKEWKNLPLVSFGHSLGAAKSIVALGEIDKKSRIKGALAWAGFSSYVKEAQHIAGKSADRVVTDEWAPRDYVKKVAPIPLLIIHGQLDRIVPISHARDLYKMANQPKKLIISEAGGHNDTLHVENKKMRKLVLKWFNHIAKLN